MRFSIAGGVVVLSALVACSSSSKDGSGFDTGPKSGDKDASTSGGGDDAGFGGGGNDGGSLGSLVDSGQTGGGGGCKADPSFYDIPGDNCDNDGDGTVDNVLTCDTGLAATGDAMAFAKAMGLCQTADATGTKWGVISATYTTGHTATAAPPAAQHGILPQFGSVVKPQEGAMLGVISSGSATEKDSD